MFLYCTQKLLNHWGIIPEKNAERSSASFIGDWTANYFMFNDKMIYLFVNNATMFSFVLKDIDQINIENEFQAGLLDALHRAGISFDIVAGITKGNRNIIYARNTNRRILGSINNLIYLYQYTMNKYRSIDMVNMSDVESKMWQVPFKNMNYKLPIELLKIRLNQGS